jgi:hypothetical protein
MVWTMDSQIVTTPGPGPGRCFIAREVQRRPIVANLTSRETVILLRGASR